MLMRCRRIPGDFVRSYAAGGLADPDAALVLDDRQVIKKGTKTVGVAPQHSGLTGNTENCQVMVMLSYASVHGHAFIDRELYLPHVWVDDPARCAARRGTRDAGVRHQTAPGRGDAATRPRR